MEKTHLRCSVLQCVAVCCSVLQCVALSCSVLQCLAVLPMQISSLKSRLALLVVLVNKLRVVWGVATRGSAGLCLH